MRLTTGIAVLLGIALLNGLARAAEKEEKKAGEAKTKLQPKTELKAEQKAIDLRLERMANQMRELQEQIKQMKQQIAAGGQRGDRPIAEGRRGTLPRGPAMRGGGRGGPSGDFTPTGRGMRGRIGPGMPPIGPGFRGAMQRPMRGMEQRGLDRGRIEAAPARSIAPVDEMLARIEQRIAAFRKELRQQPRPRVMAERLRDILREHVKRLDRFLEEGRPVAKPEAAGPKVERRDEPVRERRIELKPDRPELQRVTPDAKPGQPEAKRVVPALRRDRPESHSDRPQREQDRRPEDSRPERR